MSRKPLDLEKFMRSITPAKEHQMARVGARYVVEHFGPCGLKTVMRYSGLCEIRAVKALKELHSRGEIKKLKNKYYI